MAEAREYNEQGLPRIRGDRPVSAPMASAAKAATPHTRGSTFYPQCSPPCVFGYPAYAGIDHVFDVYLIVNRRLPRIRGDRPVSIHAPERGATAAPQTRGIFFS